MELKPFIARGILAAVSVEGGLSGGHVIAVDMKRPGATSTGIHGHSLGRGDWVQNAWRVVGHRMEVYATLASSSVTADQTTRRDASGNSGRRMLCRHRDHRRCGQIGERVLPV
jgi:hypothetical protein